MNEVQKQWKRTRNRGVNTGFAMVCISALAGGCGPAGQPGGEDDGTGGEHPNVILILTDDQGYGDIGYHGNPLIKTPTIDSLATNGVIFTDFYASPRCAPARAALLTGRYPARTGVYHVTAGGYIMANEEISIAEYFRKSGYRTGIFGKWHVGDHYPYMPSSQGFEYSLIHHGGALGQMSDHPDNYWDMTAPLSERKQCYFNPTLYENDVPVKKEGYVTDIFTGHAIRFIEQHRDEPFFVYLAYNAPHSPFQVPPEYLEMYKDMPAGPALDDSDGSAGRLSSYQAAQYVYAMMTNMDDNIRRLLEKLEDWSLEENTVIIFLSDNGPDGYRFNAGFRGIKGQVFEGGIRVPCFISYRDFPRAVINQPAAHYDLLPTLADICNLQTGGSMPFDGVSLVPLLTGDQVELPERPIFIRETNYMEPWRETMIRLGDYKLVGLQGPPDPEFELFNLEEDPGETNDLSGKMPEKVNELKDMMTGWYREMLHAENLEIQPIFIGSPSENPVRLARHECISSFSSGWFSRHYMGYFLLRVVGDGNYRVKLTFRRPVEIAGRISIRFGEIGRSRMVSAEPFTEYVFEDVYLTAEDYIFQSWFQQGSELISPFYVEIERMN